ncbi:MAG: VCBS repeat-containing protein, partial [Deltaproteobacteria bacterium]
DRFCLDGNRLRSFSGTYGADLAQYQTEIADFSLIISHGTAGTGPAWFEVYAKNGLIYEYGNVNAGQTTAHAALVAAGSSTVLSWALNKIRDRVGNYADFDYTNDATNHVLRPLSITYTTSPGTTAPPQYQVSFGYETRIDPQNWYTTGTLSQESNRTNQISISAWNGSAYAVTRTYNLTYGSGATGLSRITSISECSSTQCFPATTVGYQDGSGGWGGASSVSGVPTTATGLVRMDLNGDGIDDLVYLNAGTFYYLIGQTSGTFLGPYATGISTTSTAVLPLDYYAKRRSNLLVKNASGNWRVYSYSTTGGAFTFVDTTTPVLAGTIAVDVDGDGYQDLAYVSGGVKVQRNLQGTGFAAATVIYSPAVGETFNPLYSAAGSSTRRMDFNGDGRDDFMFYVKYCALDGGVGCTAANFQYYWTTLVSKSDGTYVDGDDFPDKPVAFSPIYGDFNGDGCTDVVVEDATSGYLMVSYGACDGQAYTSFSTRHHSVCSPPVTRRGWRWIGTAIAATTCCSTARAPRPGAIGGPPDPGLQPGRRSRFRRSRWPVISMAMGCRTSAR